MDIKSPEERSKNMAAIRNKDTKPEIAFRKMLFARGYRYRKNVNYIPGHPDLWLAKYHTAIFVHGCFWHRHEGCKYAYMPKSRIDFWEGKFKRNIEHDADVWGMLQKERVRELIVWECTIRNMMKSQAVRENVMCQVEEFLSGDTEYLEL